MHSHHVVQRPFSSTGKRPFSSIGKRNASALSALKRASLKNQNGGRDSRFQKLVMGQSDYDSTLMSSQLNLTTGVGKRTSQGHLMIEEPDKDLQNQNFMLACSGKNIDDRRFRRLNISKA